MSGKPCDEEVGWILAWARLLLFYIPAISKAISGLVPTWDSSRSWWLYSAAPLGSQAISTMTWYPTQSHYPDTEPNSPCSILIMPNTWLGSDKYEFDKSLIWFETMIFRMRDQSSTDSATAPGQREHVAETGLVWRMHAHQGHCDTSRTSTPRTMRGGWIGRAQSTHVGDLELFAQLS